MLLDGAVTENGKRCLHIKIKPHSFFFSPQMIPQFQFVFIPHITVKDAVNKNDSTYGLRDRAVCRDNAAEINCDG